MRAHLTLTDEDFVVAAAEEKKRRHDVMAHVHAFGQVGKYYGRVDTASFSILLDRTLISRNVLETKCEANSYLPTQHLLPLVRRSGSIPSFPTGLRSRGLL